MSADARRTETATNMVPDAPDRRDLFWEPAGEPVEVPNRVDPDAYQRLVGVTWHQRGEECAGFAIAPVLAHEPPPPRPPSPPRPHTTCSTFVLH